MPKISLNKFCKNREIAVSTAHGRLKEAGFDTSKGLSVEAQLFLMESFGLNQINVSQQASPEAEVAPTSIVPAGATLDLSRMHSAGKLTESSNNNLLTLTSQAFQLMELAKAQAQQELDATYSEYEQARGLNEQLKKSAIETQMDLLAKTVENRVVTALGSQQQAEASKRALDLAAELLKNAGAKSSD